MKELFKLYFAFLRIGLFTIGGGYAMLPMMQKEIVEKYKWATEKEIIDYYAIGQCTPGIIAVNTSTFVGYKVKGIPGAIVATLGMISTSLVIIIIIAAFFQHFKDIEAVQHAFNGIRVAVVVLIITTLIKIFKRSIVDIPTFIICAVIFIITLFAHISPVIYVIAAGVSGLLIYKRSEKK